MSKLNKVQAARENAIYTVMERTNWSYDYAAAQIDDARKRLGMSYSAYYINGFYKIPVEEQEAKYQQIVKNVEKQKEDCIIATMEGMNCSREEAVAMIQDAKDRLGIPYRDYNAYKFYKIPVEKQAARYQTIKQKKNRLNVHSDRETIQGKQKAIEAVMKKTGWSYEEAVSKIVDARKRTGCTYSEYNVYKFYELEEAVQNEVFLIDMSRKIVNKYDVSKEVFLLLCNKEMTNTRFDKYMRRPWCVNNKVSLEEFTQKFINSERIIYKPIRGSKGNGVQAFNVNAENIAEVYSILAALPEGIIEQYVKQHPAMSSLSPSSVNTIRVVTIGSNEHPVTADGKMTDIAYAALRIGGSGAVVDNFHSGGMAAAIDLETGELVTPASDMDGHVYECHPATGTKIKGFKIPYFAEAMQLVKDAIEDSQIDGFLGWDVAIAEDGPLLIEINLRPGVVLLTAPYIPEKKGMKHVMEKYL